MPYNFDIPVQRENTNSVKYDARQFVFGTNDLLPLWVADMDFATPDFIRTAVKQKAQEDVYGYPIKPKGFYESIRNWLKSRHQWEIQRDWISFSPGVVSGLAMSVLAATQPGDKIIAQTPVYFPFFEVIQGLDRELVVNELTIEQGRYVMDFDALEQQIDDRTRAIMLCSPHNPVGRVWTRNELNRLGELAVKHDLIVVSDEIHSDLLLNGHQHLPLASLSDDLAQRTFVSMAPSKTFNVAGLSTSFIVIPNNELREAYNKQLQAIHLGMGNMMGIAALEAAYTHGHQWLNELLAYLESNLQWLNEFFHNELPQIPVIEPEATYLAWLDFRSLGMSDKELQQFLTRQAKVGLNNGARFGANGEGFMRINFACPRATLQEGAERIARAVQAL